MSAPIVFDAPYRNADDMDADVAKWLAAHPGAYGTLHQARHLYFHNIFMPRHCKWALKSVDKAGSSSTLRLLYELEWGTPFTAEMDAPDDINPDSVAHRLLHAKLLRRVLQVEGGIQALPDAFRIATVRNPGLRAVSAFFYLCKSQDLRATTFVNDRLRMGALVGFDWTRHMRTPDGFVRFIDYALITRDTQGIGAVDGHWRPQWALIRPDLFRPSLIGRVDAMDQFAAALAAWFDRPVPSMPKANRQDRYDPSPFLRHPGVQDRLANLYRADYGSFGYDPNEVPTQ